MADKTLKRSPFQTETEDEPEKKGGKRSPFQTETLPTLPTTSGFLERLGLVRDTGLLPEQPLPKRELATSPVIEEMKAKVEAEVEQGGIWKLRDEADEVSKQFQAIRAEQAEAEAMKLPTGAMRDKRSLLLDVWNKKNAELQARRAAFEEKTGFTPDEYGRSEKEISLLREQRGERERIRGLEDMKRYGDAGTTGPVPEPTSEQLIPSAIAESDAARRRMHGLAPSAKDVGILNAFNLGVDNIARKMAHEFEKGYLSRDADTPEALKILSGTMGALFEGTPKTPLHFAYKYFKEGADSGLADVRQAYGPDHPITKYFEVYSGTWKVVLDFADVMTGNAGGVATLGVGGALGAAAKPVRAGLGTAAKAGSTSAKVASAAIPAAFATHIGDSLWTNRQQIYNTLTDPEASLQEKTETAVGAVAGAVFGFMLTKGSLKQVQGVLKSRYGLKIDVKNASKAELAEAANRIIEVEEAYNAKAQGREAVPRESGDSLFTHLSKINVAQQFPKLKGERWSTFFKRVGEQQLRVKLQPEASIHETGPIPPVRGPRPVEVPVEPPIPPVIPPEIVPKDPEMRLDAELARDAQVALDAKMAKDAALKERELKFEPEAVDRRADAEAGSEAAYYDRPALQVKPDPETVRFQEIEEVVRELQKELTVENLSRINAEREAKILEAMGKESEKQLWEMTREEFESPYATASSKDTVIMYHRTSQKNAEIIRKEGLIKGEDDVVWLTEKPNTDYTDGALVEVEIKKSDIADFKARGREGWKVTDKDIPPENIKNIHELADNLKFAGSYDALRSNPKLSAKARRAVVKGAIERGENVPESVLRDFPEWREWVPEEPAKPAAEAAAEAVKAEVEGELPTPEFEIFTFGRDRYDINTGYGIARRDGVELTTFDAKTVKQLSSALVMKDPKVVAKADTSLPVLLGTNAEGFSMVIDGHHRVARAIKEGTGLDGYVLSKEQTAQVKDAVENPKSRIDPKPAAKAAAEEVKAEVEVDKAAKEVVREEDALVEAAEEAAVAAEEVPSGMPKRMLKIVEREIERLKTNGDARSLAAAGDLKVDPESFYNIFGSRRWADIISKMDKAEVDELRAEMGGRGTEALAVLLEARQVEFKYDEWKASDGDKNLKTVYLRAAQRLAETEKNFGQAVEAIKHNTHHTPEMIVDIIAAKQEQAVGGRKFTEEQRATLEGLVEKSQEAYKDLGKKQDKLNLKPTEENYEAARESLLKANVAAGEQAEFLIGISPRLWSDLYVTALQGNLLTPQTLLLNVVGNIIPTPMRATSRITARSMELIGEYLFTKPSVREQRRIELQERREELKDMDKSEEGYIEAVAEVARLEEAAMSNFMLQPLRGTFVDKPRGFIEGIGIPKVWDALKAPKGTWGDLVKGKSERWRRHKYGGTDTAISSMLHGQRMHQYEAGMGEAAISPVSPIRALRKLVGSVTGKGDKLSGNEYAKAIVESIQFSPSMMFKLLSGGDLPFRYAEFRRVIDNFGRRRGKARGWTEAETKAWVRRAKESPELMLTEKENMALWNDASKATFQNENWLTDRVGKINQWFRDPMKKGAEHSLARAAYIPYRTITPYQKTLLNITAETAAFSPLGLFDAKYNYGPKSFIYKKFGRKYAAEQKQLAYAKAITGMTLWGLYELLTQDEWRDDVLRADFSSGVTDKSAKIRHLTEDVVPDGTLNLSAFARGVRGFFGSDEKTTPQEGDNVINLQEFGVFGDILLTAAAYHEKKKGMTEEERKAIEDNWFRGAFSLGGSALSHKSRQMFNRGMAQNMKQVVQGLLSDPEDIGSWAKPFGRAITALAIPNTLDWFYNNSKDNPYRRDFRTTDVVEATAEGWTRKLVAMGVKGEENPILFDMWGRSIDRVRRGGTVPTFEWDSSKWVGLPFFGVRKVNPRNQVDRYLYASFNIMRQGQLITDIHSSEIYRLWDDHRVDGIVPPIASRLMTIDETKYKLNRDQYAVLQRLNGMFRMSGPIVSVEADEASGARGLRGGNWAGMRELIGGGDGKKLEGIAYRKPGAPKRLTTWKNLKPEVQVDEIKKMVSGSKSDARAYFLENFVKDKPNRIALITLAGLDLDRVGMAMMSKAEREKYLGKKEADAKKVIKGYSVNWDNLGFDKLEAVGEPSGKARKPLEK